MNDVNIGVLFFLNENEFHWVDDTRNTSPKTVRWYLAVGTPIFFASQHSPIFLARIYLRAFISSIPIDSPLITGSLEHRLKIVEWHARTTIAVRITIAHLIGLFISTSISLRFSFFLSFLPSIRSQFTHYYFICDTVFHFIELFCFEYDAQWINWNFCSVYWNLDIG